MDKTTVPLNNGVRMPLIGLGCWESPEDQVERAVEAALDAGYRHIDTAYNYLNEEAVGAGIHRWLTKTKKPRSEVFVVTKLPMIGMNPGGVEKFLKKSLVKLKLDYVDLYLVHSPMGMIGKHDKDVFPMVDGKFSMDYATDLIDVWRQMERVQELGLAKSIGVSNFSVKQLRKICAIAKVQPVVQQVELHVHFQQPDLQEFCKNHNIVLTAYAPLGSPGRKTMAVAKFFPSIPNLLEDPVVKLIAERHSVTTAQVLLRFLVQKGIVAIPKSVTPERIVANYNVWKFNLTEIEMAALQSLDKGPEGRTFHLGNRPMLEDHPEA